MVLGTRRLELRPLAAAAARALPGDRGTAARILDAVLPDTWPQADLLDVLPLLAEGDFGAWVKVERESGEVVGDVGFHGPPDGDGVVEIGFSVVPDRRRRGYATEAALALAAWARSRPDVAAVVAGSDAGNVASIRTLERAGFVRTGTEAGEIRWRLA